MFNKYIERMNSYPPPNSYVASAPTMPQQQNNERLMTPASLIYPHLQQTVNHPQQYIQQSYNPQAQVAQVQVAQVPVAQVSVAQVPIAPPTNFVDTESNIIHTNNLEPYIEGIVHNEVKKIYTFLLLIDGVSYKYSSLSGSCIHTQVLHWGPRIIISYCR